MEPPRCRPTCHRAPRGEQRAREPAPSPQRGWAGRRHRAVAGSPGEGQPLNPFLGDFGSPKSPPHRGMSVTESGAPHGMDGARGCGDVLRSTRRLPHHQRLLGFIPSPRPTALRKASNKPGSPRLGAWQRWARFPCRIQPLPPRKPLPQPRAPAARGTCASRGRSCPSPPQGWCCSPKAPSDSAQRQGAGGSRRDAPGAPRWWKEPNALKLFGI